MKGQRKGGAGRNDEWVTPPGLFRALNDEFGFRYDAAATEKNTKCPVFATKEDGTPNGATWAYQSPTWCNPPYSQAGLWLREGLVCQGADGIAVMLVTVTPETKAWQEYVLGKADEVRFLDHRVRFWRDGAPAKASHTLPSAVIVFRPHYGETRYFSWGWE